LAIASRLLGELLACSSNPDSTNVLSGRPSEPEAFSSTVTVVTLGITRCRTGTFWIQVMKESQEMTATDSGIQEMKESATL
jgi:hypothetical protein